MTTVDEGSTSLVVESLVEPTTAMSELRGRLAGALRDLGEDHLYDVLLVVSELVNNVLDHASGFGRLRVLRHATRCEIAVEVDDGSPAEPVRGQSRLPGNRGRGIAVVAGLARQWGVRPSAGGKTVFAVVGCPDDGDSRCGSRMG